MSLSTVLAIEAVVVLLVPLFVMMVRFIMRSMTSARRVRAYESPNGHYRRSYAQKYANQYTPNELTRSAVSEQQ
jgi:NADH:ubiquinone oxidoreductase subunit 3 (subunit A)